jgi:serine/threonine-protein kinase
VAKLLDFGLVRQMRQSDELMLTAEHTITGSPSFMSPEQATGDHVDRRSDVYSLGAVAYLLLTGSPPFAGERPMQVIIAHANESPAPLTRWNPEVPADLERVVLKCLSKRPEERFQSAEELREALDRCHCRHDWDAAAAAAWWSCHGCPQKRQLDEAVVAGQVSALAEGPSLVEQHFQAGPASRQPTSVATSTSAI